MKKINNLNELAQLIGNENLEKCFIEKFMLLIAQSNRQKDLDNNCAIMDENEMIDYINNIGRTELFDEIEDVYSDKYMLVRHNCPHPYPRYLKAIRVSLVEQGYDEKWVEGKFKTALENKYLPKE